MKRTILACLGSALAVLCCGCGGASLPNRRVSELQAMPALWESDLLVADPKAPDLKTLIPLYDSYDPNIVQWMTKTEKHTDDYIPESVRAFAREEYENRSREITLRIGDRVSVLAERKNKTEHPLYLVRTPSGTYAWVYAFHLQNMSGKRMARLE